MVRQYRIVYPEDLNHHGVKGMKWGVRKQIRTLNKLDKKNAYLTGEQYMLLDQARGHNKRMDRIRSRQERATKGSKQWNKYEAKANKQMARGDRIMKAYNAKAEKKAQNLKETQRILKDLGSKNVNVVKNYKSRSAYRFTEQLLIAAGGGVVPIGFVEGTKYKRGK